MTLVQLHFTPDGRLILPDPDLLYCPNDKKGTRRVREHVQRVREEMIAEHERLKAQVLERIRNQPSARAAEAAAEAAAAEAAAGAERTADGAERTTAGAARARDGAARPTASPAGARHSTEGAAEP